MTVATARSPVSAISARFSLAPLDVPVLVDVRQAHHAPAIAAACGGWDGRPAPRERAIHLKVAVSNRQTRTGDAKISIAGATMDIRGPGVAARARLDRRTAVCSISREYLAAPDRLRNEVLEPLVLMLVTLQDRAPIHASGFVVDGLAVLLAGRSGAGKSCLARAADAAGLQLLSDDSVYVQRRPELRVWGWPTVAHLLPRDSAGEHWPTRMRNGRAKHVVPLRSASPVAVSCRRAVLCVLDRGDGVALTRLTADEAVERLWPLDPGYHLLPGPIRDAVTTLASQGAWKLQLSDDPAEAIELIAASLPQLAESGSSVRRHSRAAR